MPSSRATMTEIVEKSKQLLDSVSLAPRGDDSVLVIVACLRLPAYLGISWRLWFETYHLAEGNYDPLELALVFCGIAFALYFLFLLVNNRRAFVSVESKRAQILLDLLVYSGAYVLTQDPQSDIYYLNILPLLLTVEYFSLQVTVLVAAWVIALNAAQFAMIPSHSEVFSWASRDFLPRSFVITIIGVAYLVHRRLRNVGDAALDRDRESW
ncbi:MAG: hypothetical protein IPK16_17215 [Anaerolineales bacterium]|nr:hypothetical protein [Anaerolineales bacterium]